MKDIKLLDGKGKFLGLYKASEARKKAVSSKKDLVLVNEESDPMVCKIVEFRRDVLNRFYDEVVTKQN